MPLNKLVVRSALGRRFKDAENATSPSPGEMILTFKEPGRCVAAIERSIQHVHLITEERYEIVEGQLVLVIAGIATLLEEGQHAIVPAGHVHQAIGTGPNGYAIVDVTSAPPWDPDDHLFV